MNLVYGYALITLPMDSLLRSTINCQGRWFPDDGALIAALSISVMISDDTSRLRYFLMLLLVLIASSMLEFMIRFLEAVQYKASVWSKHMVRS